MNLNQLFENYEFADQFIEIIREYINKIDRSNLIDLDI